jgi:uncharacterized protein (TIGR02246 family)
MKPAKLLSVIMLLFTCLAAALPAAWAQGGPETEVRKLERAWLDAYEQRDEKAMDAIVADDFTIFFPDGSRQTKSQIITGLRRAARPGAPTAKFYTEEVQARVYGNTVILTGRVVTEMHRDGKMLAKEQQRYTDTYVKQNQRWQVVASHLSNDKGSSQGTKATQP